MRHLILYSLLILFLSSCQGGAFKNDHQTDQRSNEQEASKKDERLTRFEGYEISKQRRENFQNQQTNHIQDKFTTQKSIDIANHLMSLDEINRAQVVETDDKLIVGVIINLHADSEIAHKIEKEVASFVETDKDIIVFTDDTYWYDQIDERSSSWAVEFGEDIESIFDNFFNIAD